MQYDENGCNTEWKGQIVELCVNGIWEIGIVKCKIYRTGEGL
jgi:hypothetical protein